MKITIYGWSISEWLIHTNRRLNGSWSQRYERGVPVTDLEPVAADGTTGTCVRFLPDETLRSRWSLTTGDLVRWSEHWPDLTVRLEDQRDAVDRSGP
ncbi:hypothetical protein [Streptomyces sp. NRRL S-813]|uniref:hypothetical protein n=1 Tax=Streptomyces sp. NRRL S-813 TaxID=1463919 RepID=UPI0006905DE8|nr:hypothetical protein [Streptomyces sp. NRRL S-813]